MGGGRKFCHLATLNSSNIRTWRDLARIRNTPKKCLIAPQSSSSGKEESASASASAAMRQVKSLTPDRERRLAAKAAPAIRKAGSTKGLKEKEKAANDENSSQVSNVRGATAAGSNRGAAKTAKGRGGQVWCWVVKQHYRVTPQVLNLG